MNYIDLHCDTLTVCLDNGFDLLSCDLQTSLKKLISSGCAAQCFAIFTEGGKALESFENYLSFYKRSMAENSHIAAPVLNTADLTRCKAEGKLGCILTCENLGFIGKDLRRIDNLAKEGVKMASLVWNNENALAYPNLIMKEGKPEFEMTEPRGLKEAGREAVDRLDKNKIIIDISHLSDGGAEDILSGRKSPVLASHSNARAVSNVSRNLPDGQIKKIADCGGVIGVNFCVDFLGGATMHSIYDHIIHIINVGGEDVIALGSDFDGIPTNPAVPDCSHVPDLFSYLYGRGIPPAVLEKFAYKNFERVFKEICE